MKYLKTSLLFLCMTLLVIGANAQSKPPFAKKQGLSHETEVMKKDLGLNAAQTQKVEKLNQERADEQHRIRTALKNATPSNANRPPEAAKAKAKEDRKAMRKEYRQGLKAVLTPEQFEKWKELKQAKKKNK